MKRILSKDQALDLAELQKAATGFGAPVVIIGAVAMACFLDDLGRFTADVDLVIALELGDFDGFAAKLATVGWHQEARREHRWRAPRGSILDILPAGPELRAAKHITWPGSQFRMSLVGFEHVFDRAILVELAPGVSVHVAPLPVIALLKMVAHLDDPYRRAKDLGDLKLLLHQYDNKSGRIYSGEVFSAELEDIEQASAFLLGLDLGQIATAEERKVVRMFIRRYSTEDRTLDPIDAWSEARFQSQLKAFAQGIGGAALASRP